MIRQSTISDSLIHKLLDHARVLRHICIIAIGWMLVSNGHAQGTDLKGDWSVTAAPLMNGEAQKAMLHLEVDHSKVTGKAVALGFVGPVTGDIAEGKFKLYLVWDLKKPMMEGTIRDDRLEGSWWERTFVGRRTTDPNFVPIPAPVKPPEIDPVVGGVVLSHPPMGWNSWNFFEEKVSDEIIRQVADAMVKNGMRDAGYTYINIDDSWEGVRNQAGELGSNRKFPDMKALAEYVHQRGFKLGIYSSPGPRTCGGYPGSYGHELQDARTFASWGIDFLKYDWCSAAQVYKESDLQAVYQKMGSALAVSGRPIVFSLCEYGTNHVTQWGADVGATLWRTTGDINDSWESVMANLHHQQKNTPASGPGRWNDPDMLEVGNGHMTDDEYIAHFSLWALSSAPLLAGNDVRQMSGKTRNILLNSEVIAIDQDELGLKPQINVEGPFEVWRKRLSNGDLAVGVLNLSNSRVTSAVELVPKGPASSVESVRDLWLHQDVDYTGDSFVATVPGHGIRLLRIVKRK